MRLNNLAARLIVNKWLQEQNLEIIPASVNYLEFATNLRTKFAPKQVQANFVSRPDAVAYIRLVARKILKEESANDPVV